MKKQALLEIKAKNPEKVAKFKEKRQRIDWKKLREMKSWPKEKKNEFLEERAQLARSKWMGRWRKYFPDPESPDGINHNNPYLEVEWAMCDIRFLWKVCNKNKAKVDEALSTLSNQAREIYLYGTGPGNSKPYYEVSLNGSMLSTIKTAMGMDKSPQTAEEMDSIMNDIENTAESETDGTDGKKEGEI